MTEAEFDKQQFRMGMRARFNGKVWDITGVDFQIRLIELTDDEDNHYWEDADHVEILNK